LVVVSVVGGFGGWGYGYGAAAAQSSEAGPQASRLGRIRTAACMASLEGSMAMRIAGLCCTLRTCEG